MPTTTDSQRGKRTLGKPTLGETTPNNNEPTVESSAELAERVQQRIVSHIRNRIHDLKVRVDGNDIWLTGRCATYYSKQLAQHAALGILEDEHSLHNDIQVSVEK